jgi:acetyl-CoA/propionyl-CoA carboxylase
MKNGLSEFSIEGINTTIPLYKSIMDEQNFINGELSTDYIERFRLLDKMNEDAKEQSRKISSAAIAAILLQSEFVKKGRGGISSTNAKLQKSKWKKR